MSNLKRIVIHHTGGVYTPSLTDREHYHYLIDFQGHIIKGTHTPQDNIDCKDNNYAAHIKLYNTGSIGVACCGNRYYSITNRLKSTAYPLTQVQIEAMCNCISHLCTSFDIPVTKDTVFTHYEYDQKNIKNPLIYEAKSDITFIPYLPTLPINCVGDYLRSKVKWYLYKNRKVKNHEKT